MPPLFRRAMHLVVLTPAIALTIACNQDTASPRPTPTYTRMILNLAPTGGGVPRNVEITRATSAVSGPLTIGSTGGTLTSTFLNADGSTDAVIETYQADYETRITLTEGAERVAFTRTGPNTFTVTRSAAGSATAHVALYDLKSNAEVNGANVTLTVQ